jgi:hypothetical protein
MRFPLAKSIRMERRGPAMALGSRGTNEGSHAEGCQIVIDMFKVLRGASTERKTYLRMSAARYIHLNIPVL